MVSEEEKPRRYSGGIANFMVEEGHWTKEDVEASKRSWDAFMGELNEEFYSDPRTKDDE